jgi:RNA polymerase sigma-70 factor (ECF subfamily)
MQVRPVLDGPRSEPCPSPKAPIRALVDDHFDFIWRLFRRQGLQASDADDAAQQVFLLATQKIDSISPGSERSFLYGTALRVAANIRRTANRRREVPEEGLTSRLTGVASPDDRTELRRAWTLLDELFAQLPNDLGRALALAEIEQVEVAEIAALEQIPVGTAASRLRRARAAFRALLATVEHRNPFRRDDP